MCSGDFDGQVGRYIDGFDGINGGYGVIQRNLERGMLLECGLEKELYVSNTWFRRDERWKVSLRM